MVREVEPAAVAPSPKASRLVTLAGPFCLLLSAAVLAAPALANGYPLVFSDTGTYISASFTHVTPIDRPIGYSLFLASTQVLKPFGGFRTLWLPLLAQSVLGVIAIWSVVSRVTVRQQAQWTLFATVAVSLTTALPWVASLLMPDVFTGIGLAALTVMVCDAPTRRPPERALLALCGGLVVLVAAVHYSNAFVLGAALLLSLILAALLRLRLRRVLLVLGLIAAGALTVPLLNRALVHEFYFSKSAHVFLMTRMTGDGLIQAELDSHCSQAHYILCAHRSEVGRFTGEAYAWDERSALYRVGGWEGSGPASWPVILGSVRHNPTGNLVALGRDSLTQMFALRTGYGVVQYQANYNVYQQLRTLFPREFPAFLASRQQRGEWSFAWLAAVDTVLAVTAYAVSLCLVALCLVWGRRELAALNLTVLAGCVANAVVTAGITWVTDRYQTRVLWVLVLAAALTAVSLVRTWAGGIYPARSQPSAEPVG